MNSKSNVHAGGFVIARPVTNPPSRPTPHAWLVLFFCSLGNGKELRERP